MSRPHNRIPLQILICDPDAAAAKIAEQAFTSSGDAAEVEIASSIRKAQARLRSGEINTIIIDPLAFELEKAAAFIFGVRKAMPEIVFVLYVNKNEAERRRSEFYRGERKRFAHYYALDKKTPIEAFADEVKAVVELCQMDLSWRLSKDSLDRLLSKAGRLIPQKQGLDVSSLEELRDILSRVPATVRGGKATLDPKTVFLSHRFAEKEYVGGLTALLEKSGFTVRTGMRTAERN